MRSKFFALSLCLLLAACAEDIKETGITRAQAIFIAKRACPEYPDRFAYVDKAEWVPEKAFWAVLLDDSSGDHGRVYKINRDGRIVGTRDINVEHPAVYYGAPYYGPGPYYGDPYYYGSPYYGGPYYYGGPTIVVGVHGHGPYHHGRWH